MGLSIHTLLTMNIRDIPILSPHATSGGSLWEPHADEKVWYIEDRLLYSGFGGQQLLRIGMRLYDVRILDGP